MTKQLLDSVKRKNKLYQKTLKNNSTEAWNLYKQCMNKLTHEKEKAKKVYYEKLISQNEHNSSLLWKTINDIVKHKTKVNQKIPEIIDTDNNKISSLIQISNTFNNFFVNVGMNMANNISTTPAPNNSEMITSHIKTPLQSFFLSPITEEEILMHLRDLNTSKSTPTTCPSIKYIKMAANIITPILTKLFNCCIETGTYPDILKVSEITPIFKSGDKKYAAIADQYH